ncbi:hypothetical protein QYQ98_06065 [Corynebacterium sp. P3-F1]|uniref:hypothetical protein n=1 Tax=Corynebacterium sp. P3-F1 TaxID=3059080 RepID=UPI00265D45F5|nr:hypothetical protein [Corynebacterium sp. P3-F1]WKK60627.1 hypothetical protein QYQ98_06065 [Corynebacterium sp. P3-F1]
MNLRNIRIASAVAGTLFNRYRDLNNEQKRDVYEAVRLMARGDNDEINEDTSNFSAARLQAGDVTRAAHARLDRRRALFEQDQLDKKEKKELEKALKKQKKQGKKSGKSGKSGNGIALGALILALLAAIAGGVYYLIFGTDSPAPAKKAPAKKVPQKAAPAKPAVQKTQPPTQGSTRVTAGKDHGPLSEEPAERDEELLNSIDEQLSTLDTLDDAQRENPGK